MSRLSLAMLFSIAVAAGSAVAQTTTVVDATNSPYTIPGSTIAAGDTVRVVTGGSLDPSQGTVTNDGTLEYAPTVASGTMTLRNSLSGTGRVLKTGDGTLNLAVTNRNFAGDWRLQAGNVVTTLATHISGNSESTTNLLGTGEEIFEGNIFGRQGITGTGAFTVKGIGTPVQSGFQFMPYGYFSGANSYSGTTVLDGGVFIFNPMISTISTSAFGTSSVELRNAVTLMHTLGSSTPGHPQNVFTIPNGIVLNAGHAGPGRARWPLALRRRGRKA